MPLPNEPIDVAALLAAGGRFHDPDRRTWRGAVTYQERVLTYGIIIAQLAMIGIPLAVELLEAVMLARAAALAETGAAASSALETSAARLTTAAVTEEIPSVTGEVGEVASPSVAEAPGTPTLIDTPPVPVLEPLPAPPPALAAELDAAFQAVGGPARGYTVQLVNDGTVVQTATGYSNAGAAARSAGGAVTDVPARVVYVHESVVQANGVVRSWGARLNLRQVIAHELGHGEAASFDCCMASRCGADLAGLNAAERTGLLEDAARIAPKEGVPLGNLDLPPDFQPPTK